MGNVTRNKINVLRKMNDPCDAKIHFSPSSRQSKLQSWPQQNQLKQLLPFHVLVKPYRKNKETFDGSNDHHALSLWWEHFLILSPKQMTTFFCFHVNACQLLVIIFTDHKNWRMLASFGRKKQIAPKGAISAVNSAFQILFTSHPYFVFSTTRY